MAEDLEQLIRRRQDELRGYPLPPEKPPSRIERLKKKADDLVDNPTLPCVFLGLAAFFYAISLMMKMLLR